jgi:hypothetical protein
MEKSPSSNNKKSINYYQGVNTKSDFTLINKFLGYRSREDKTILPPGYTIWPSQNVQIDLTGRLKCRLGYTRYGASNSTAVSINSWWDWEEHKNAVINLRASQFSDATTTLQFDYNGTWTTIKTGLGNKIRFCNYWKGSESENVVLFVDGSTNVYEWNGSTTTVDSVTTNTIKKQGTATWAADGFYAAANKKLMIRGVEYTYTGGETTTTLTGVTPDPTAQGANTPVAGDLTYQSIVTQASITGVSGTPTFDGISNIQNQIYYGRNNNNVVYVSKVNDYTNVSQSTPRVRGDGATLTLRSPWVAFVPQETTMYISGGKSQWFQVQTQLSVDNTAEAMAAVGLKTSPLQGALSQEAMTHDRNSVVILTNETRMVTLGRVQNIYETPMMTDYSFPVAKDFDLYDWTDASVKFHKSFIYVAVPKESKWLIFNQTDPNNMFWEAPQTGQFSGFMIGNDGALYAHGYNVPETYKLFDGGSDNGHPIQTIAKFSYYDYNARGLSDYFN